MENSMENPIIKLAELCQQRFKQAIQTEVVGQTGPCHAPTIIVQIHTPNGKIFEASGKNQKIAKQSAALLALDWLNS